MQFLFLWRWELAGSFLWRWELAGHPRDAEAIWLESSGAKDFAMAADACPTSHPIRPRRHRGGGDDRVQHGKVRLRHKT
jgi:hypothetical protein